jgi:polyhydroxyalkanoate synthase
VTPALAPLDAAREIRREVHRTRLRARNAIKIVGGKDPPRTAPTPKDPVWSQGKATLYRYRSSGPRHRPPVLIFLGLVGRAYVFDLYPGNSMIEQLLAPGYDVFLMDWGVPDAAEGNHSLDTYLDDYLAPAVHRVAEAAGTPDVTMIGYCMGAMMAVLYLGSRTETPVSNLILLTPPCDWDYGPPAAKLIRERRLDPGELIDETTGVVPTSVLRAFFKLRKPTSDVVQYVTLWENLWRDEYIEGHRAMTQWVWDLVPFAGPAFRQLAIDYMRDNAMMKGTARIAGRPVDLGRIRQPTLIVRADRDDFVPPACSAPMASLLGSDEVEEVNVAAGHAGAFMGRASMKVTIPAMIDWLERHSTQAAAA